MPLPLAKRLQRIAPSATLAMTARAREVAASGRRVFTFGVGEPDFETPATIQKAAVAAVARASHYTPVGGTPSLKEAICFATERDRGWRPEASGVTVSVGAKHALFNLALVLCDSGDELVVPAPYWVSYPAQWQLLGGVPVVVETQAENNWLMDPAALRLALSKKTKAILLCTPSNPTGAAYDRDALLSLANVLRESDAYIIVDEIYGELTYDGFEHHSLAKLAPDLRDRLIVIDGVSKTYAMTGWRVGWSLAPTKIAKALQKIQGQSTTNPTAVAQAAAEAALLGDRDEIRTMRDAFSKRRKRMVEGLNAIEGIKCGTPKGAFYAFPDVRGLYGIVHNGKKLASDEDVAMWQLDTCGIAAVPGSAFGAPGYLRFTYASAETVIDEALAALKKAVGEAKR